MRNVRKTTKRALSVILAVIMTLSCFGAGLSVIASAADGWTYVEGTKYEPVTLYVRSSSLTSGKTYLLGLASETAILTLSSGAAPTRTTITTKAEGQTTYYTAEDGKTLYTAGGAYVVDTTGSTYAYNELQWNSNKLYNPTLKQYLAYSSKSSAKMNSSAGSYTWTFGSSKLTINSRYLRFSASSGNVVVLGTTNSSNTIYPYEKVTVYEKVSSGAGGYYTYNGQVKFTAEKGKTFNESAVRNAISVLYKAEEETTDYSTLTINDPRITLRWNETVNTSVEGTYTAKVLAEGVEIATISVDVTEDGPAIINVADDPSTSDLKSKFRGVASDDGKILTDKTVKYGDDEFNAFTTFDNDEFSIALSALGQSYQVVETEEIEYEERLHPDVIFVIDASGSMRQYTVAGSTTVTRAEATATGLNEAIKELYAADPETRIGIVTYGFGIDQGVYLPLDKYTLPEGQTDYITWGGRMVASTGGSGTFNDGNAYAVKTVSSSKTVSSIKSISRYPGYQTVNNQASYYNPSVSDRTTIATVNGVTYYAVSISGFVYIFTSEYEQAVAILYSGDLSGNYKLYSKTYIDDNISITITGKTSVSYTTNTYTNRTGNIKLSFESNEYMMATNYLINSEGEVVKPSCHHFLIGIGTFTQAGLQAAENMFAEVEDKENRIPSIILLSDGIPTVSDTNTATPHLNQQNGVTIGYGNSTKIGEVNSQFLCDHGLRTIETAMSTKETVDSMYTDKGEFKANFYTIGPGVDYIFGQTILDPSNENIAAAAAKTTNVGENTESGVGVPSDLAKTISAKYSDLDYVDYADWSFTGDMSSDELTKAFVKIAKSISSVSRPIKAVTMTTSDGQALDGTAGMKFTDTIGDGMELRDEPVLSYGGKTYRATSHTTSETGGKKVETYRYDYNVTEASTGKTYTLNNAFVNVIHDTTGEKEVLRVEWYIPAELVPVIFFDEETEQYSFVDPIRVIYKVGIADKSHSGTYYANSVENPATSEFTPAIGNPYYYNNEEGTDGKMHSTLKTDNDTVVNKTDNETDTLPYAWDVDMITEQEPGYYKDRTGTVITTLGNNGVESLKFTQIDLTKIWEDSNDVTGQRPDHITVQVYRNGAVYGEPRDIYGKDCETYVDEDGNDVWHVVVDGLPYNDKYTYSIDEIEIPDHDTYITNQENKTVITNTLKHGKIEYELYLVDVDGNPINEYGEEVTFENRTVMSDLVEVEAYINTTTVIDYDELNELLPDGYYIYNPDTSYTEKFMGAGSNQNTASVVDNDADTTKVFYPTAATIGSNGTVSGLGDFSDVKIAFAIAKIEILPDVIVVDYGKPILCEPLKNDAGAITLLGVGAMNSDKYGDTYTSQNGVFTMEGNNVVFSPFSYMSSINRTRYYVTVRKNATETEVLNSTIYVIPATTVYYEDDFGGSAENGGLYIKYTGAWTSVADNGTETTISANTYINDRQDRGEVGEGHVPYGYDSSYDECIKFSNGTATVVEGTISKDANGKNQFDAYAEFTFTGTGFDIISRTDLDCGTISVAVYDSYDELVANVPVINKGVDNLYQIPVISFTGLDYDTYNVKINVNAPQKLLNITGSTFYLDAIRIYNPMGLKNSDNREFNEANAAYYTDKEANAFVASIRDYILAIEDIGTDEESGAVYVDTINNDYVKGGVIKQDSLETFHITGPNEEVYLTPGKGVGFALVCSALPETVQLEIKIPAPHTNNASLLAQTNGKPGTQKEFVVHSAAEMFYDITDAVQFQQVQKASGTYYRAVVILSNGIVNAMENDIVSITNVKLTYAESVKNIIEAKDEDIIITSGIESTVIDEEGNIVEEPTQVSVGVMANWNLYCDAFDTIYTQHQATIPTYDVAAEQNAYEATYGDGVTATFTTSRFVDDLVITDAEGNEVEADVTSEVNEELLYTADFESAKTWTVTFNNAVGEYNYTVAAADGEGETADVNVSVKAKEVAKISAITAPSKTQYTYGEEIDTEGLELLVTYADGTTRVITSGYQLSTYKADKTGTRSIKVTYGGQETSFKINVKINLVQFILTLFGLGWLWK